MEFSPWHQNKIWFFPFFSQKLSFDNFLHFSYDENSYDFALQIPKIFAWENSHNFPWIKTHPHLFLVNLRNSMFNSSRGKCKRDVAWFLHSIRARKIFRLGWRPKPTKKKARIAEEREDTAGKTDVEMSCVAWTHDPGDVLHYYICMSFAFLKVGLRKFAWVKRHFIAIYFSQKFAKTGNPFIWLSPHSSRIRHVRPALLIFSLKK